MPKEYPSSSLRRENSSSSSWRDPPPPPYSLEDNLSPERSHTLPYQKQKQKRQSHREQTYKCGAHNSSRNSFTQNTSSSLQDQSLCTELQINNQLQEWYHVSTDDGIRYWCPRIHDQASTSSYGLSDKEDAFARNMLMPILFEEEAITITREVLGRTYKLLNIMPLPIWHYFIRTLQELRDKTIAELPFKGGEVDSANKNERPLRPKWRLQVSVPKNGKPKSFRVLGTEKVITCTTCSGRGKTKCRRCSGKGRHHCYSCHGNGRVTKTDRRTVTKFVNGEYKEESESINRSAVCSCCGGMGERNCDFCYGDCKASCKSCSESGKMLTFEQITVRSETVSSDFFTDSPISESHLKQCHGLPVCQNVIRNGTLTPFDVTECLSERMKAASKEFIEMHNISACDGVIRKQEHFVVMIPAYKITAEKRSRTFFHKKRMCKEFWIAGTDRVIYNPTKKHDIFRSC